MTTVLVAVGEEPLRSASCNHLRAVGFTPLVLERPLAALSLPVAWDVVLVDGSTLGTSTLAALRRPDEDTGAFVSLGPVPGCEALPLPLDGHRLVQTIEARLRQPGTDGTLSYGRLRLDMVRRSAIVDGTSVSMTRTEVRLLEALLQAAPGEVAVEELLRSVWRFADGSGGGVLVRSHVRNLRLKLARLGLPDAIVSRRGRGYALLV